MEKYDPDNAYGHLRLGLLATGEKRFDDALVELRKADEIEPNSAQIQYRIGMVQTKKKDWSEAAAAFRRAVTIDPNHIEANRELIASLRQLGQKDEAIQYARSAAKRTQNLDILMDLVDAYADASRFDDAPKPPSAVQRSRKRPIQKWKRNSNAGFRNSALDRNKSNRFSDNTVPWREPVLAPRGRQRIAKGVSPGIACDGIWAMSPPPWG